MQLLKRVEGVGIDAPLVPGARTQPKFLDTRHFVSFDPPDLNYRSPISGELQCDPRELRKAIRSHKP